MSLKEDQIGSLPPHSIEAEMSVLGAMMLGDKEAVDTGLSLLNSGDFYRDAHSWIFNCMKTIRLRGEPIDIITLQDALGRSGFLEQVSIEYLLQLADIEFTTSNIVYYAKIVKEKSQKRQIIEALTRVMQSAYCDDQTDVNTLLRRIEDSIGAIEQEEADKSKGWEILSADDLLDIDAAGRGQEWLVPNVLVKGGVHFVSAPAAGAKSWLMLDLARCITEGVPWLDTVDVPQGAVLYIDEEMGKEKTSKRIKQLDFERGCEFLYLGKQGIRISDTEDLEAICKICTDRKIVLVCLDTLTGVRPGLQENEASHVSALRTYFARITATGATLLVAHHDRKSGQGESEVAHYRMAGSRDFGAMSDMAYGIEKRAGYYHLEVTKNRLLSEDECLSLDFILEDSPDRSRVTLRVITPEEKSDKTMDILEERIITALRTHGKMNTNTLLDNVRGTRAAVVAVLNRMAQSGTVLCERVGNAKFYSVAEGVIAES